MEEYQDIIDLLKKGIVFINSDDSDSNGNFEHF